MHFYHGIITFLLRQVKKKVFMATTNKIDYAKALIKAGLNRELIIKITSISEYEDTLLQRELASA